jgi:predicted cupin superfamily sugar epimerase
MAVRYSGYMLKTRRQAAWQNAMLLMVLLPLAVWRATTLPAGAAIALVMITVAPFGLAYQAWRFLEAQEQLHRDPTDGMMFAFRFLASTPVAFGGLLFVLLTGMR